MIGQLTAFVAHIYSGKNEANFEIFLRFSYFIEIQLVYETNIRMTK